MTPVEKTRTRRDPTTLRLVDCDVHQEVKAWSDLFPYLEGTWVDELRKGGGPPMPRQGYRNSRGHIIAEDMISPRTGKAGDDPEWVKELLFDRYGVDIGILTTTILSLNSHPNLDMASAIARAYNDWTLDTWVRPHAEFKGSIVVATQDPDAAADEIDRLGEEPGMVQVMVFSGAAAPYGHRRYHKIWEAAARHNLPIGMHAGGEGMGIAPAVTTVGPVSWYVEQHTLMPQSAQAHCVSLIAEGVFEKFSGLTFLIIELGLSWAPHIMWRFDKDFKGNRSQLPWLTRLPSEYFLDHIRFSTQPIDEPRKPEHLLQIFEMMEAERTLLYASDYPHWDFDNPKTAFNFVPAKLRRRIFVENAVELYGERLLGANAG
jgi:uncharacterized protein